MEQQNLETKRIILKDESRRNWLRQADDNLNPSPQSYRHQALSQWIKVLGVPRSPAHFNFLACLLLSVPQSIFIGLKATESQWIQYTTPLAIAITTALVTAFGASVWLSQLDKSLRFSIIFFWSVIAAGIGFGGILTL